MTVETTEEVVVSKKRQVVIPKRKSRAIDWYSEHDTDQEVFEYVRDPYNNVVGVRVDGGIYR